MIKNNEHDLHPGIIGWPIHHLPMLPTKPMGGPHDLTETEAGEPCPWCGAEPPELFEDDD